MAKKLSLFEPADGLVDVYSANNGSLRCSAIKLRDNSLCLFSPVAGLNRESKESIDNLGEVSHLLAPNHYHNKGIAEYVEAFPNAILIAPDLAKPRLGKITNLKFESLETIEKLIENDVSILYPQGLKTGEIWLSFNQAKLMCWMVVDSFCSTEKISNNSVTDSPEILKPFPKFGVADIALYRTWVDSQLSNDQPNMIVPCHGSTIHSANLSEKIEKLMQDAF